MVETHVQQHFARRNIGGDSFGTSRTPAVRYCVSSLPHVHNIPDTLKTPLVYLWGGPIKAKSPGLVTSGLGRVTGGQKKCDWEGGCYLIGVAFMSGVVPYLLKYAVWYSVMWCEEAGRCKLKNRRGSLLGFAMRVPLGQGAGHRPAAGLL